MFYFSFITIRKFAGGYHAKTPIKCYIISVVSSTIILVLINIIPIIVSRFRFIEYFLLILGLFSLIIICYLSPLDTINNPLNNEEKILLKKITIFLSVSIYFISCLLIVFSVLNIGIAMMFGIFMSNLVLALRKATTNH